MADELFRVSSSVRLPGLGVLLLPVPPAPTWLAAPPLHTAVRVQLHCPGQPPQSLPATIEEIGQTGQPLTRALLLDADPGGEIGAGAWLEMVSGEINVLL